MVLAALPTDGLQQLTGFVNCLLYLSGAADMKVVGVFKLIDPLSKKSQFTANDPQVREHPIHFLTISGSGVSGEARAP